MKENCSIRQATIDDLDEIIRIRRETFVETFVDEFSLNYSNEDLNEFFRQSASNEFFTKIFSSNKYSIWILEEKKEFVGYSLIGLVTKDVPHRHINYDEDGQIHHFYLKRSHQRRGLAQLLMERILLWFEEFYPSRPIWLSVWSRNVRAQRFYRKFHFEFVGQFLFSVGNSQDEEFIFQRKIK